MSVHSKRNMKEVILNDGKGGIPRIRAKTERASETSATTESQKRGARVLRDRRRITDQKTSRGKPPRGGKNGKSQKKILGSIQNLEEYVRPDWWRGIFNSLYLKTDGDVADDDNPTQQELDLFTNILRLDIDDRILDLCCGQGRHSLELARRGFKNVEGLDCSHYLVQKAKTRAKKEYLHARFREGDARRLPHPPDTF